MAKYEWSEVFMSIEGEGPHSGRPTIYIRFTGCNFECRGFNNPENVDTTTTEVLGFDPKSFKTIHEIPLITKGCDSIYSWDPKFKHMWRKGDEQQLGEEVISVLPHNAWEHPSTGQPVILSLTGGEPTLRAKTIPTLINHPMFAECRHILFETNCSVPLTDKFLLELNIWLFGDRRRKITWSNSPKLAGSGEPREKAIKPLVALAQRVVGSADNTDTAEQYFKFVCGPTDKSFNEVDEVMKIYHKAGIPTNAPVYIMPVACTEEQQQEIAAKVALMCIDRGYSYCHRIQNSVFGNGVGT